MRVQDSTVPCPGYVSKLFNCYVHPVSAKDRVVPERWEDPTQASTEDSLVSAGVNTTFFYILLI